MTMCSCKTRDKTMKAIFSSYSPFQLQNLSRMTVPDRRTLVSIIIYNIHCNLFNIERELTCFPLKALEL